MIALVVDRASEIVRRPADLQEHLVEMPHPTAESAHMADAPSTQASVDAGDSHGVRERNSEDDSTFLVLDFDVAGEA